MIVLLFEMIVLLDWLLFELIVLLDWLHYLMLGLLHLLNFLFHQSTDPMDYFVHEHFVLLVQVIPKELKVIIKKCISSSYYSILSFKFLTDKKVDLVIIEQIYNN